MVLFLAAAVVLSDQLIKIAVVQFLKPVGSVTAIPGLLDLVYVENTGAAFGLFADQRWVFIALTIIFVIVLIAVLFRLKITSKIYFTAMFLILGGAVGNLICGRLPAIELFPAGVQSGGLLCSDRRGADADLCSILY